MDHRARLHDTLPVLVEDYTTICFRQAQALVDDLEVFPPESHSSSFVDVARALASRAAIKGRPTNLDAAVCMHSSDGQLHVDEAVIPIFDNYRELCSQFDCRTAIIRDDGVLAMLSDHSIEHLLPEFRELVRKIQSIDTRSYIPSDSFTAPLSPQQPLDDFGIFGLDSLPDPVDLYNPADTPAQSCAADLSDLFALSQPNLAPLDHDRLGLNSLDDMAPAQEGQSTTWKSTPNFDCIPAVAVPEGYVEEPILPSPEIDWDSYNWPQCPGTGASSHSPLLFEQPRLHPGHTHFNSLVDEYRPRHADFAGSSNPTPLSSLSTPLLSESLSTTSTTSLFIATPDGVPSSSFSSTAPTREILGTPQLRRRESHMSDLSSEWHIDGWEDDGKSADSRLLLLSSNATARAWNEESKSLGLANNETCSTVSSRHLTSLPSPSPSPQPKLAPLRPTKRLPSSGRTAQARATTVSPSALNTRLVSQSPLAGPSCLPIPPSAARAVGRKAKRGADEEEEDSDDNDGDYDMDANRSDVDGDDDDYRNAHAPKRRRVSTASAKPKIAAKKPRGRRRKAPASKRRYRCPFADMGQCTQTFGRKNDAQRHVRTACPHAPAQYRVGAKCAYMHCARDRDARSKPEAGLLRIDPVTKQAIFTRKDACKRHMMTVHASSYSDGDEPEYMEAEDFPIELIPLA